MELNQLYTRGTKMAEVDPAFKGMPFWKWRLDMLGLAADRARAKIEAPELKKGIQHAKPAVAQESQD